MSLMGVSFEDGPAKGQSLMLQRAPLFLRAVRSRNGKWDALDQLEDQAKPTEAVYAYIRVGEPGVAFIDYRGRGGRREGRRLATAEYRIVQAGIAEPIKRNNDEWTAWCFARPESIAILTREEIEAVSECVPKCHSLGEVEPGHERAETCCLNEACGKVLPMAKHPAKDGSEWWVAWCYACGHVTFGLEPDA